MGRQNKTPFALSTLHQISNPGYLEAGGVEDTSVMEHLRDIFNENITKADENLQSIIKGWEHEYINTVMFPEAMILRLQTMGFDREEAESKFVHVEISDEEREQLKKEISENAKNM